MLNLSQIVSHRGVTTVPTQTEAVLRVSIEGEDRHSQQLLYSECACILHQAVVLRQRTGVLDLIRCTFEDFFRLLLLQIFVGSSHNPIRGHPRLFDLGFRVELDINLEYPDVVLLLSDNGPSSLRSSLRMREPVDILRASPIVILVFRNDECFSKEMAIASLLGEYNAVGYIQLTNIEDTRRCLGIALAVALHSRLTLDCSIPNGNQVNPPSPTPSGNSSPNKDPAVADAEPKDEDSDYDEREVIVHETLPLIAPAAPSKNIISEFQIVQVPDRNCLWLECVLEWVALQRIGQRYPLDLEWLMEQYCQCEVINAISSCDKPGGCSSAQHEMLEPEFDANKLLSSLLL